MNWSMSNSKHDMNLSNGNELADGWGVCIHFPWQHMGLWPILNSFHIFMKPCPSCLWGMWIHVRR